MCSRIVLCLVAFVAMTSGAGTDIAAQTAAQSSPPRSQFLWKVTSDTATVYLFGTMHVGTPEMLPTSASVRRALDNIETLFVEIDPQEMSNLASVLTAQKDRIYMPDFKGGLDLFSPEALKKIEQIGGTESLKTYDALRPWMVGLALTMNGLAEGEYTAEFGLDQWLIKEASARHTSILSLETAAFQIDLLCSLYPEDLAEQAAAIEKSLENWDTESEQTWAMVDAYRAGDFVGLEAAFLAAFDQTTELGKRQFKALVIERNERMTAKVRSLLAGAGRSMVAVGAGHMLGTAGIVQLLRDAGFTPTAE